MKILNVTQVTSETDLRHVVELEVEDTMWERLGRVFPVKMDASTPLCCWLDNMDETGATMLNDEPIVISADQAVWLLREFMKLPESVWSKVTLPQVNEVS